MIRALLVGFMRGVHRVHGRFRRPTMETRVLSPTVILLNISPQHAVCFAPVLPINGYRTC